MSATLNLVSWLLLMSGSIFVVLGGVGLLRMPDFYSRMHPSGLVDTMGAVLIVAGLMLQAETWQVPAKLALILVFLFFTSPTAPLAVAHAALADGLKPWTKSDGKDED